MTDDKSKGASVAKAAAIPAADVEASKMRKPTGSTVVPDAVDRPDKNVLDKQLKVIDADIDKCRTVLDEVKKQMDVLHGQLDKDGKGKDGDRSRLNQLRSATKVFVDERKTLFQELDKNKARAQTLRDKSDAMQKHLKEECKVREFSTAAVQKKIGELDYYLSTTPLALKEEKEVIAQIKALNSSKKVIAQYDSIQEEKDSATNERKELSAKLDQNKKSFQAAKETEDSQWEVVKKAGSKDADKKDQRKSLLEKREKAKTEMNEHYTKIKALREEYRKKETAWRKYNEAKRAAERERYLKEEEERKDERKLQKLQEEGESEDTKHATKLSTIEQLIVYLSKFVAEEKASETKEEVSVERDGMQAIGKNAVSADLDIFGTVSSKKGARKGKKGGKAKKKTQGMQFDVKALQEFEQLEVPPPMTIEEVSGAMDQLKTKRDALNKDKEVRKVKREAKMATVQAEIEAKNKKKEQETVRAPSAAPTVEDSVAPAVPPATAVEAAA